MDFLFRLLRRRLLPAVGLLAVGAPLPLPAQVPNIDRVEYFFDTDPGYAATSANLYTVPLTPGTDLRNLSFPVSLTGLQPGVHSLFIRSRAGVNNWSQTLQRPFYISNTQTGGSGYINRIEYFVDNAVAPGSGTAVGLPNATMTDVSQSFLVPLSGLSTGVHSVFVRTRDDYGNWSQTLQQVVYVDAGNNSSSTAPPALSKVEWFLDTDPGYGAAATSQTITGGLIDAPNLGFAVGLGTITGFHTLYMRTLDAAGRWSQTLARPFFIDVANVGPNITRAEYFFDTPVAYGSGVNIPLTAAPDLTRLPLQADASSVTTNGMHRLYVRSQDANGRWSVVLSRAFGRSTCGTTPAFAANLAADQPNDSYNSTTAQATFNGYGASTFSNGSQLIQANLGTARSFSHVQLQLRNLSTTAVSPTLQTWISTDGTNFTLADSWPVPSPLATGQTTPTLLTRQLPTQQNNVKAVQLKLTGTYSNVEVTAAGLYVFCGTPPSFTSFTPASGGPGTTVTLVGANLTNLTGVTFNGVPATSFNPANNTAVVPAGATNGPIQVTVAGGTLTSATAYQVYVAPTISSFTPTSGPVGTSVTLTGANLTNVVSVSVGGIPTTFTPVGAISLTLTVPAGLSSGQISVTTLGGTATSTAAFAVSGPTLTVFAPTTGAAVGATVTLTGTSLTGATSVTFNGVPASSFNVVSATSMTAVVPPTATTGLIRVTTPTGTATTASFKVLPTVTGFSPAFGPEGRRVTIWGTGFLGATAVKFNTTACPAGTFLVLSENTISALVPSPLVASTSTTGKITVTTAGGSGVSTPVFNVAPVISSLVTTQGRANSVVLVLGRNFTSTTKVYFNGVAATTTYNSTSQLTAIVPTAATPGANLVSATNPYGTGVSATTYNVLSSGTPPTITTNFTPLNDVIVGSSITITGSGFTGATLVRFNNANATNFTIANSTNITATVPAGALTGKIYVATSSGMAQSATSLTIIPAPTITTLSPTSGAVGSVVLIGGANYSGTTMTGVPVVKFNGVTATSVTVNSATQIAAVVPTGATKGKVTVQTVAGTATSVSTFTVLAGPAPTITSLSPPQGLRGSSVVVTGTGFTGVTSVKLGTVTCAYTVNSSTQITATVPATATTGRFYVTTSGGGMAQSPTYTVILAPTITAVAPTSIARGATLTITGTNFAGITGVTIGGVAATTVSVVSTTSITATVPGTAATGATTVTVTNSAGAASKTLTVTGPQPRPAAMVTTAPLELTLYPNPATAWVEVAVTGLPTAELPADLLDGLGRVVRTYRVSEGINRLMLDGVRPGPYVIRLGGQARRLIIE